MALSPARRASCGRQVTEMNARVVTPKRQKQQVGETGSSRSELLLQLHLASNPEALCLVRATVERAAEVLHFRDFETRAIVRSVDEALANVIRHAYQGKRDMPIEVTCRRLWEKRNEKVPAGLEIILSDAGIPVNPAALKGRALNEIRPGGLGLHFIKESMDVVEFSRKNGRNFLRLVKNLARSKPEERGGG